VLEPLYTAAEMRAAEERYPRYPESIPELMERAGAAVAREAMLAYPEGRFACVCGGGSNGGDGRVAARILREAGHVADETEEVEGYDVIVDALFGTGFRGEPRPDAAELIRRMNEADAPVIAIDVPSGVDSSSGEATGVAVEAELTVTFHAPKVGLVVAPGRFHAGKVVVADIGLDRDAQTEHRRATPAVMSRVPRRSARDTKYTAGAVLVVGGQPGMTGAACLTARAALRADAGYVTLAVPEASLPVVETLALEPVKVGWSDEDAVASILGAGERARAVALGPGLGRSESRQSLVRELLERLDVPVVVDADALYGLEPVDRTAPLVLTPHAGELARLLDAESGWVDAHRLEAARTAAERYHAVVLLKGVDTIVAEPGSGAIVCDLAPPGALATAGTGDVLTGVVAAFLAKGVEPRLAAAAAASAHGLAARSLRQPGLVAGDVVEALPAVLA
jgi:NAD(P)H-hydrate epimerase